MELGAEVERKKGRGNSYKYVFLYPNPKFQQITTHTFPISIIILKLVQILLKKSQKQKQLSFLLFLSLTKRFLIQKLEQLCSWPETGNFPVRGSPPLSYCRKRETLQPGVWNSFFLYFFVAAMFRQKWISYNWSSAGSHKVLQ